jgi:hypothetical protein
MLIFKAFGATFLAGALAASGVITTEHLSAGHDDRPAATATASAQPPVPVKVEADVTTAIEPPTTGTTAPLPPPQTTPVTTPTITLPPPLQPTVIPVAGAGTVVIVLQGPIVVVRDVKVVPGWFATVERRSGEVDVLFRNGDRSFRFFASIAGRGLTSGIREVRADGDHPVGFGFNDHDGDSHRSWH